LSCFFPVFNDSKMLSLLREKVYLFDVNKVNRFRDIQGDFESCADILITSYWLHVELGKNI
jgi:hypothetical protein